MPIKSIWLEQGTCWEFSGIVTSGDIKQAHESFYSDSRSDRARYRIVDTTGVTRSDIKDADIVKYAACDYAASKSIKILKVALVAGTDQLEDHARRFVEVSESLGNDWEIRKFHKLDDAKKWCLSDGRIDA
ncbi:hypothetical protein [Pelagicoccus sp. SDUM812002]|uniref:hypothetical protein n=1 Tax=Pelagicoccus sp. SDUM812002 TaxID=3041266 RepID=UPI00280C4888|nr:hypothetical protein [Pelagicoccus sp. SDUM812002]MDQ8187139.1 hypothetical protein [Pelagicoccus sp. SDUM812002]